MRTGKWESFRSIVGRSIRSIIQFIPARGKARSRWTGGRWERQALPFFAVSLLAVSLACNAFAGSGQPLPEPPALPQQTPDTVSTPLIAATVTLPGAVNDNETTVTTLVDLNIREGPGVQFARIGLLPAETTVPVVGLEPRSGWWKIRCPEDVTEDSCWISGGARYVTVTRRGAVPTVAPPPAPATNGSGPQTQPGHLAYLDGGQLYVADLRDVSTFPAEIMDERRVSEGTTVEQFLFSPNGRRLAYVAGDERDNALHVVGVDGVNHLTLVTSKALQDASGMQLDEDTIMVDQIQWLPDSDVLAFNTRLSLPNGSTISQEDLWTATLDGAVRQQLAAGQGGGRFFVETEDRALVSRESEIARASLKDGTQEVILSFDPINTASEYVYYPQPQRTAGGVFVAIPATEPFTASALTTLYKVPARGAAVEMGVVSGANLEQLPRWSATGQQMAYVEKSGSQEQMARLYVAGSDGSNAVPYAGGAELSFLSWKPREDSFLYAGPSFYALGRLHDPPTQTLLSAGTIGDEAQWVTEDSYLLAVDDTDAARWELHHVNQAGEVAIVARGSGMRSSFELWLPG